MPAHGLYEFSPSETINSSNQAKASNLESEMNLDRKDDQHLAGSVCWGEGAPLLHSNTEGAEGRGRNM